ncbi:type II toxin-antitoxin system HicB family antitoxin [Clostridium sp. Marseille-P299]|uniref:type II toxin-antitoxin system HicB family antitoxin n=1 Tax=Clostridium sp. Marseille-P299 TaxID=1805477 RepID=UPI00083460F1|nr:type II toxin-antitoxin system HicB family antitoxin [Clostridium sp. Marseille-P299]
MLFAYPAIFHEEDSAFWVEFPDLIGCQSFGDTLNETIENAQEALSAYVLTLLESNQDIPTPSKIKTIMLEDSNSFTSLVSCNIDQYKGMKAIKKTLTIPSWLNDKALAQGINFSKVLQDALLTKIQS